MSEELDSDAELGLSGSDEDSGGGESGSTATAPHTVQQCAYGWCRGSIDTVMVPDTQEANHELQVNLNWRRSDILGQRANGKYIRLCRRHLKEYAPGSVSGVFRMYTFATDPVITDVINGKEKVQLGFLARMASVRGLPVTHQIIQAEFQERRLRINDGLSAGGPEAKKRRPSDVPVVEDEAGDELYRLQKENERLKGVIKSRDGSIGAYMTQVQKITKKYDALSLDIERYLHCTVAFCLCCCLFQTLRNVCILRRSL
jgi:hypothetical protein